MLVNPAQVWKITHIPHEPKPIPSHIPNLVVLPSHILHNLKEMQPTPRINRRHRPMRLTILEPTPTRRTPHQPLHQLVRMVVQILNGLGLRLDGFNPLGLHLLDHLEDVARVPF